MSGTIVAVFTLLFTGSAILAALGLVGSFFINYEIPLKVVEAKAPLVKGVILEKTAIQITRSSVPHLKITFIGPTTYSIHIWIKDGKPR